MSNQYRQGDVLFKKVDKIPRRAKPKKDNIVVEGEATGHAHRVIHGEILIGDMQFGGTAPMFVRATARTKIVHEEHDAIELPEGIYEVVRQREFSSTEDPRFVTD